MPIQLGTQNRRRFIATAAGLGAGCLAGGDAFGASTETLALLSDTHISAKEAKSHHGSCMAENFNRVIGEVRGAGAHGVIISGDCAHLGGREEDYQTFSKLVRPLVDDGGVGPVHLLMGNHDDRESFRKVLSDQVRGRSHPVVGRVASRVRSSHADWYLLDTLRPGSWSSGELGREQLGWLARELDADPTRPAIIVTHHDPGLSKEGKPVRHLFGGLKDADELLEILRPRRQVKALTFGHTHRWGVTRDDSGMHLVNLPPVAYVFDKDRPNGWVRARLSGGGMDLEMRALDKTHPEHAGKVRLAWR